MNSFGRVFKVQIFGESHGLGVGICIDGCPAGLSVEEADFEPDLSRRRSGAKGTTPRKEADIPELMSGIFNGKTTGAPITIFFKNMNTRSGDYANLLSSPRPGHADYVGKVKFGGFNDYRGGGHFSARLTTGIVAAGVLAKKLLPQITIQAFLTEAGGSQHIEEAIDKALADHNSIGGIVECRVSGLPVGIGEPFWDSLESVLSHAVFAIPAVKGIEFGSGFQAAKMTGWEHNDSIVDVSGKTETNYAGGINGGISNGNELVFRVAIKPTSSIAKPQQTMNFETKKVDELIIQGRHDACVALRVPPILEAMTAIVLVDFMLLEQRIPRVNKH
ncbi:MAG TPA: chorismate synthase [Marinilabiliales bacterium]|nr:MAG: chorismate synthase [Bacteroidetes bacterium GWA2_40_14]OFX60871.1 MAG: chorismate synthase [Bacteroidetes bacterium GWC2_40_13]OFX71525.1 MAG: chorismate synthase [Bacteroidetes bacterium GWD2_40_43]OFX95559.1 MAG: chorismate synthase [Bacteroidetes bacterium GWE2_40_63]OFZ24919.1 MAG: chorismate synthase [Bacteroidetes bacterium RIFOXYC2_FULL_40_12]HAN00002.1 chorismate synthase [Marinilabiliales bacterium]